MIAGCGCHPLSAFNVQHTKCVCFIADAPLTFPSLQSLGGLWANQRLSGVGTNQLVSFVLRQIRSRLYFVHIKDAWSSPPLYQEGTLCHLVELLIARGTKILVVVDLHRYGPSCYQRDAVSDPQQCWRVRFVVVESNPMGAGVLNGYIPRAIITRSVS